MLRVMRLLLCLVLKLVPSWSLSSIGRQYVDTPKGLWVWDVGTRASFSWRDNNGANFTNTEKLVHFATTHGFDEVVVFVGAVSDVWKDYYSKGLIPFESHFADLFTALRQAGITPLASWYLNSNPNSFANYERGVDVVRALHLYNKAHPLGKVAGLSGDQEPDHITQDYENMNKLMRLERDHLNLTVEDFRLTAALRPMWLNTNAGDDMQRAVQSLDTGNLMAYTNNQGSSQRLGTKAFDLTASTGKPLSMMIEVSDLRMYTTATRDALQETFWKGLVEEDKDVFFQMVVNMQDNYITNYPERYNGRLWIHHYGQYYKALYGTTPDHDTKLHDELWTTEASISPSSSPVTLSPTNSPVTNSPTMSPSSSPSQSPSNYPTQTPSLSPTLAPSSTSNTHMSISVLFLYFCALRNLNHIL